MIRDTSETDKVVLKTEKKYSKKTLFGVIAVVAAVLFALFSYNFGAWIQADKTISKDRLRIATVKQGKFERSISVQGRVVASIRPTIYSLSDGVARLKVQSGDTVKKGQVLISIHSPEIENRYKQVKSGLDKVKIEFERLTIETKQKKLDAERSLALLEIETTAAQRRMARMEKALKSNIFSQEDYELAQDTLANATIRLKLEKKRLNLEQERLDFELKSKTLEVDRQELELANVQRQKDELEVASPTDGFIGNLFIEDRDKVTSNQSLLSVINLSEFEVHVDIAENYADSLFVNMNAELNLQGDEIKGVLSSVSPEVSEGYVKGRIRILDQKNKLKQNQRVTVKIVLESKQNALIIARGPFLEEYAGGGAYVVKENLAEFTPIKVGGVGISEVEVLEGLSTGDNVIISTTLSLNRAGKVLIR